MDIEDLGRHWDAFGECDPMGAVLADPAKAAGTWDAGEFFATGEAQIRWLVDFLTGIGLILPKGRALDFGSGLGRLTRALASRVDHCLGIDISSSMIAQAKTLNADVPRCEFLLNKAADLARFRDGSFDLVVSWLVLQHMPPPMAGRYIAEFVRVLAPDGVCVFQLPSHPVNARSRRPLPDDAVRARIAVSEIPSPVAPKAAFTVKVDVTNESDQTWPVNDDNPINVGNHWRDGQGALLRLDDGRAPLPLPLEPGATATVVLPCTAPEQDGHYRLDVDIVQECVTWFSEKGVPVAAVTVHVDDSHRPRLDEPAGAPPAPFVPKMEMNGIPLAEIVRIVERQGGVIRAVFMDARDLAGWTSYLYVVGKPGALITEQTRNAPL